MISLFHLLPFFLGFLGLAIGLASKVWIISLVGAGLGFFIGTLPGKISNRNLQKEFAAKDTEQLLKQLDTELFLSFPIIRELVHRGHSPQEFKAHIIRLMDSSNADIRQFGWQNLKIWLPEFAQQIPEFNPRQSTEICKAVLAKIKS